ncbi:MAG: thrombospondin type 3 repeat-containing protein [Bacteroidota bacterium]
MNKKLLLLCLIVGTFSHAQYNKNAPWMLELQKSKSSTVTKTSNATYTFEQITNAFHTYWEGKDTRIKGSGYKPFMRWENYWKHFVKSDGSLPTAKELWEAWEAKQASAGPVNPTSNWTALGPVVSGELNTALPGIGRINAIAVDPNNADVWYAGAPAGGIWKSTDGGSTWANLFDDFPQIGVSGIAIDPNDSNIVYIATGDDDASDSFSAGVFKSLNGGTTWNATGLDIDSLDTFEVLNEIVIDPTDSNVLWVGGSGGLRKSINAGDSWEMVLGTHITDFKLKPNDPQTIYAVGGDTGATLDPNARSVYYKSIDGGAIFTEITDTLPTDGGRKVLGVSPANPDVLYILAADTAFAGASYLGLFKSMDSGETFEETANTENIFESSQAWFDLALEVSPTNADELYTGVLNIWKSSDGGDSFTQLNQWFQDTPSYTHADIHTLKFFGDKLFCGSDGGLFVTDDGGTTFTDYSDGLAVTQFYRIGIAKNNASKIVGGTQDNSGFVFNNNAWNVYTGGDGMDYEIDPTNSNIAYGFVQFGDPLFITNNLGQSVGTVSSPDVGDGPLEGNWITPLALDSEGTVYAAYDAIFKLVGNEWEQVSDTFADGNNIDDLEIDPNNTQIMYAADEGNLYRSEDGGATFVLINDTDSEGNTIPFDAQISDIAINSNDSNIVYLTTSSRVGIAQVFQPNDRGVYKVTVNGNILVSSENITFDLPTDQAYFAIVHQGRNSNNPIFVGTSLGVYRLDDTLTEWEQYSTGFPSTAVSDLEISPDDELIVASTYGRGAWQSPIPVELPANDVRLIDITPNANLIVCGEIIPEINIENKGQNAITQIDITYSLNGDIDENFVFNGDIASGETTVIPLPALAITALGSNELSVTTTIIDDAFEENNTQSAIFVANSPGADGAIADFENEDGSLVTFNESGGESVWERGIPSGTLLNTVSSGTQVLGTNLSGNHPDGVKSFILSRCYDFTEILAPVLKFDMAYDLEINFDIVYVEYSVDEGTNWNVLGKLGSQPNWYNSDRTNASSGADDDCQNCPGAQWTGTDATMTEYSYDFVLNAAQGETDLTGESNVLFRIVFESDPFVNQEGAIVDDFVVVGVTDDDDDDDDSILDINDNCPLIANIDQEDNENDGIGDICDSDDDNDNILDFEDNCPLTANSDQSDFDGDGIGDACDDDVDNDGVPNAVDLCSNTPLGSTVDVDGCEVFSLPADNFALLATGESCISNDNGSIQINTINTLNYTATLTDSSANETVEAFTDSLTFSDLAAGTYMVCITVEGQADYERCFDIDIVEPEPLGVDSKVNSLESKVVLDLSGGTLYTIELNGERFTTTETQIELPLNKIENTISVKTDKDCQGIYEETIVLTSEIFIYPNPVTSGDLNIYLGSDEFNEVETSIFNLAGIQILGKSQQPDNGYVRMNVSGLSEGIYLLNIKTEKSLLNYKIIKR